MSDEEEVKASITTQIKVGKKYLWIYGLITSLLHRSNIEFTVLERVVISELTAKLIQMHPNIVSVSKWGTVA